MSWVGWVALGAVAAIGATLWWRLSLLIDAVAHLSMSLHYEDAILRCRGAGRLDTANKLSELQRWADVGYEARWLDGMFRGFP
jgi:hypothetical protein